MNSPLHLAHRIILPSSRFLIGGWLSLVVRSLLLLFITGHVALAQAPIINSFLPTSGGINSSVVISGSNFVGTTSVRFGEISAKFTVNSNDQLTVTVPRVASTQPIIITSANGYALTASAFTVTRTSSSLTYSLVASNFGGVSVGGNAAPVVCDLDNDNLLDLLVGHADGTISRYEQTATNSTSFNSQGLLVDNTNTTIDRGSNATVSVVDANGDGKFSLLLGGADGYVNEYEQTTANALAFTLVTDFLGQVATTTNSTVGMTDLDGDGTLEFLTGKGDNYMGYFNQSSVNTPTFYRSNSNFLNLTSNTHPFCVDLDGNGLIDVLIGEGGGSIYRFEQSADNSINLTQITSSFNNISAGTNAKPCVTDIDGDGLLDLLVGRADGTIDRYEQGASANAAPTDISLNPASVAENQPVNSTVGTLSTTDPNAGNTFTYTFASGGTDNGSFSLSGSTLTTNSVFNYEAKNSYSIKIRSTDQGGLFFEKTLTVSVNDVNEPPTVTGFSPMTGLVGASITINGTHFSDAGNVTVRFNGTTAGNVSVINNTQLTATVPSGATTGTISVQNSDGTGTSTSSFTVTPQVNIVSAPASATYGIGAVLNFRVVFNQLVTVTGTPNILLTVGSTALTASYVSGSNSTTLVFSYTVGSGDLDNNGVILGSAINLNGGTIRNGTANANLTLNNVASTTGVRVDGVVPTVNITSTASNTTTTSPIPLSIAFSESVSNFAVGDITVTNATKGTLSGSGANYTLPITPTGTGIVTITVNVAANAATDGAGNGNTASNTFTITYSPPPTITNFSALDNTICIGSPITFSATVGNVTGSYTFTVTNGTSTTTGTSSNTAFSQTLTATSSGSQTFTLRVNGNSQIASNTTNVTVNTLPTAGLTNNGPLTCAQTSVTLTASGGNSYTFVNSSGTVLGTSGATTTRSVTTPGAYSVTVGNANGCISTTSTTVSSNTVDPSVNINPSSATLTCASPSVSLTAVGTGTLLWSMGSTASVITANTAATYSVTLTSANGCKATASTTVSSNTVAPSVSITPSSATLTCASPSVSLTAVGTGTVLWSTGLTASVITANTAATYSVTLTSANGCKATASVVVVQDQTTPSVNISPSSATLTCASPSVSLTAVGNGPVLWSTGSTASVITVNTAGPYSVTLTNANGCMATASVVIGQDQTTPSVNVTPSSTTLTCASPSVLLTAVGTGTVLWSTGSSASAITATTAAIYSVTLTNASGCKSTASAVVVQDQAAPSVSITPSSATLTCASPSVSLTAVGTGSVLWSTGSTASVITVNTAGPYSVTLTNGNGCMATASITIDSRTNETISFTGQPASASSVTVGANVSTGVSVSGSPTGYQWYKDNLSNPVPEQNSATLTLNNVQLSDAGSYSVVVSGACNSLTSNAFSLSVTAPVQPAGPFAITAVTTVSCTPITPNKFSVSFTPRYDGLTGQPISFSVINELLPTTDPGPYTLQLYTDNPTITLKATQTGTAGEVSFAYNWLEACQTSQVPNTPPTLVSPIASQMATAGTYFSFVVPDGTFTDSETPLSLKLSASGLPAGLDFTGATLSGVPSTSVGSPFTITITATDPGGLTVSTPLLLTVLPASQTPPPTQPFAITGVTTISCTPVADRISISFAPRYAGMNGQAVAFQVVNELAPTTDPAPYSLTLYRDNGVLNLKAAQTGSSEMASFSYNWLAACANLGQDNTAPRVNSPVANQTATVGVGFSLNLSNTFADQETPDNIALTASGLPDGLALVGTNLTGTPSVSGVSTVVLTATDPGNLSTSTSFMLTASPASSQTVSPPPSDVFSITAVTTVSCEVLSAGERRLTFMPNYIGLSGQPILFSVVNELSATNSAGPYVLNLYTDNPTITLKATQSGSEEDASFAYNWLSACTAPARVGVGDEGLGLQVHVLGNPVVGDVAEVEVGGVIGQSVQIELVDGQGNAYHHASISQAGVVDRVRLPLGSHAGMLLVRVSTATQQQTVKLIRL